MAVDPPLAQMSVDDKLQAMELLWADLSRNPEQLASPAWHGGVLRSRREQVLQGQAGFQSWDAAIGELRAELRGHQAP
ncbi:MAG: addiction module protein [Cyanobacteriota bacterium]